MTQRQARNVPAEWTDPTQSASQGRQRGRLSRRCLAAGCGWSRGCRCCRSPEVRRQCLRR
eukprot:2359774-Rhodomonas_salina.2